MVLDVQRISGTPAEVAARLCNFETAKSYLLSAHIEFLDTEVRKVLLTMQGPWVDLFGYASRIGNAAFNMSLSRDRIKSVRSRIEQYKSSINFQIYDARGELDSGTNERDNSGYYRAVEIYLYASKPRPIPIPPKPKSMVRRITKRAFSKTEPQSDMYSPEDQTGRLNDLLKLLISAGKGNFTPEGFLGTEDLENRIVRDIISDHRVNKVKIDKTVTYNFFVGGNITQTYTNLSYDWGYPAPMIVVEEHYTFKFQNEKRPPIITTRLVSRKDALGNSLLHPPAP